MKKIRRILDDVFRIDQFHWQIYSWKTWGLSYSRHPDNYIVVNQIQAEWDNVYLIIGPLQMRWREFR